MKHTIFCFARRHLRSAALSCFLIAASFAHADDLGWGGQTTSAAGPSPRWAVPQAVPAGVSPLWSEFEFYSNGWAYDEWLGWIYPLTNGWVFHLDFGWFFPASDDLSNFWIFDQRLGFMWTSRERFPTFYDTVSAHWLRWLPGTRAPRWFFDWDLGNGTWIDENTLRASVSRDPVEFAGLTAEANEFLYLSFTVPVGVPFLRIELSTASGEGDPNVYLNPGSFIDLQNFAHASLNIGSSEVLLIESPAPGLYAVMIEAYSAFEGATLRVSYPETVARNFAAQNLEGRSLSLFLLKFAQDAGTLSRYLFFDVQAEDVISLEAHGPVVAPLPDSYVYTRLSDWTSRIVIGFSRSGGERGSQFAGTLTLEMSWGSESAGTVSGTYSISSSEVGAVPAGTYSFTGTFQLF